MPGELEFSQNYGEDWTCSLPREWQGSGVLSPHCCFPGSTWAGRLEPATGVRNQTQMFGYGIWTDAHPFLTSKIWSLKRLKVRTQPSHSSTERCSGIIPSSLLAQAVLMFFIPLQLWKVGHDSGLANWKTVSLFLERWQPASTKDFSSVAGMQRNGLLKPDRSVRCSDLSGETLQMWRFSAS